MFLMELLEPRQLQINMGRVIRAKRSELNFSQESLAHAVGVHRTYVGSIERGEQNVSILNLGRIANTLQTPLSRLVALAEEL